MAEFDLIIRGAHVIDAAQNLNGVTDIAVREGKVVRIGNLAGVAALREINGKGLYASPGWIDLHAHVYSAAGHGVDPDREAGVMTGVTTVVDPGSAGAEQWDGFLAFNVKPSRTRVLAFLNISPGPSMPGVPRHGQWSNFNQRLTIRTVEAHQETIVGVKVLASQTHCGFMGIEPVKLARQAADLSGTRVMCHIGNAPPVIQDVLNLLAPGDIVTHCWHGKPGGILDRDGKPIPEALAAAERGVLFDIGHGQASFGFNTARRALEAGFPLHAISTDIHLGNVRGPVFNQATTMAKFLHLGMSLYDVVRLSTLGPARCLAREAEIGSLLPGRCADITLFRVTDGEFRLTDSEKQTEMGRQMIEPVWCLRAGEVCLQP
jgi:dihydroorotase